MLRQGVPEHSRHSGLESALWPCSPVPRVCHGLFWLGVPSSPDSAPILAPRVSPHLLRPAPGPHPRGEAGSAPEEGYRGVHEARLVGDVQGLLKIGGTSGILTDSLLPLTSPFPHCPSPRANREAILCSLPGRGAGGSCSSGR